MTNKEHGCDYLAQAQRVLASIKALGPPNPAVSPRTHSWLFTKAAWDKMTQNAKFFHTG
jgi:hypothetical protein